MKHQKAKKVRNKKQAGSKKSIQKARFSYRKTFPFRIALVLLISGLLVLISRLPLANFLDWGSDPATSIGTESVAFADLKPFPPPSSNPTKEEITFDDFVGSDGCAECHKEQFDVWKQSTHGRAGGPPNQNTVISNFDGKAIRLKDAVVTPLLTDNEYTIIVEQTGFPKKAFKVDAVIGGGHMEGGGTQSYFSEFTDGTLRFLPFDFIREEKLWFGHFRNNRGWLPLNENLSITDLIEWPPSRILGSSREFSNCQQCHGSQINVQFDIENQRYVTQYKSLAINCESCHGPGKRHIELAKSGRMDEVADIGMRSLSTLSKDRSLGICFQCHSIKGLLEVGYLPGKEFEDYYSLKLAMEGRPYHPDGRIQSFGYQQNHLYSDCYVNGSMTCVDCHDPHSQTYRAINGNRLEGRFDNGQCIGCHASKGVDLERHTFHKTESQGSRCTSCHMPYLQHKGIGNRLKFTRSDHTVAIPRPTFDAKLGIENACKICHSDKTTGWLEAKTKEWYGQIKPHIALVAGILKGREVNDRRRAAELVLNDSDNNPIAQAAGLLHILRKYLTPNMTNLESEIVAKLKQLCKHRNTDIKALALMCLHLTQDHYLDIRAFLINQIQILGDDEIAVRKRWSVALNLQGIDYRNRRDYEKAVITFRKGLEVTPSSPAILVGLGITYGLKGDYDSAILCYQTALKSASQDPMIHVYLGIAHGLKGDSKKAMNAYRKALSINPNQKSALFNLGNLYYEAGNFDNAIAYYKRAVEADPALSTGHFALARAYTRKGQLEDATASLKAGLQFDPENRNAGRMFEDLQAYLSNQ